MTTVESKLPPDRRELPSRAPTRPTNTSADILTQQIPAIHTRDLSQRFAAAVRTRIELARRDAAQAFEEVL